MILGRSLPVLFACSFAVVTLASCARDAARDTASEAAPDMTPQQATAASEWIASLDDLASVEAADIDALALPVGMTAEQTTQAADLLWDAYHDAIESKGPDEFGDLPLTMAELAANADDDRIAIEPRRINIGSRVMPFNLVRKESLGLPENGRALFICTHGGGANSNANGPHAWDVNTREWQTQTTLAIRAYTPEGIYFVPRMVDDRMGRWWHNHNQDAFNRLIRHAILFWGVDPNRVYKLGISEGGYGTDILAPFMPDLFAGANAMAAGVGTGNPPENLRNLAFRTDVGEQDTQFNRVTLAKSFHERLDELHEQDPEGYTHNINAQPGRGHGIDYRPGVPWIAEHTRNPHPDKVVWVSKQLHGRRRGRMYWVGLTGEELLGVIYLHAEVDSENNTVTISAEQLSLSTNRNHPTHIDEQDNADRGLLKNATVQVMLNDQMLDLDKPVTVICNGEEVFSGPVQRSAATMLETLLERGDPQGVYPVRISIELE